MALPKLYELITWINGTTPALNEDNLNAMSQALDDIDDRVIDLAGTIMEDVPQIQEDMAILGPAVENIDANVARAEAAADSAEQYAEEIAPPIEVVKDYADIITVEDAINKAAKDVKVKIDAVQDLHGYSKPWVGGAGKNILPMSVDSIKAAMNALYPSITWDGNSTTFYGITHTILTDDDGNVVGIKVNGTENAGGHRAAIASFTAPTTTTYYLNGTPSGGGGNYLLYDNVGAWDTGSGASYSWSEGHNATIYLYIAGGATVNNIIFKPMLRTSGNDTFEPYTNICPITGFNKANATIYGSRNAWDEQWELGSYNASTGEKSSSNERIRSKNLIPVKPNTAYYVYAGSYAIGSYGLSKFAYDSNGTYLGKIGSDYATSFTTPLTCAYMTFSPNSYYGTTYQNNICINISDPSFNGQYEPYKGSNHVTIDLGGTRYGGTLDVDAGTLTLGKGYKIYDGSNDEGWMEYSALNGYFIQLSGMKTPSGYGDGIANYLPTIKNASGVGIAFGTSNDYIQLLNVYSFMPSSLSDFRTYLASNPLEIVYELATPQTITLTPEEVELLLGYNTLWADTGDISLTYDASGVLRIANAKLDIDTFKSVVAASSDFSDFKSRVAAL